MDQLINYKCTNYKHQIDFLISESTSDTSLIQPKKNTFKPKRKLKLCNECNRKRKFYDESHQVCHVCYKAKTVYKSSGNKVIDDFIRHTLINGDKLAGRMEFVPYDRFKDVEFIAEGGFSKIYKATWIDGPIKNWNKKKQCYTRYYHNKVVLKKLNNSKEITSKELNEVNYHKYFICMK